MEPEFDATEEIVEFMEAMSPERAALLKLMYLADIMEELKAKGLVEITGINDSGELVYRAVRPS